jgi:hypothetical protein
MTRRDKVGAIVVKFGMLLAGTLFIFAAVKPTLVGGSMDVTLFVIGIACALIGVVLLRMRGGPDGSTGA